MGECLITRRGGSIYKIPVLNENYPEDTAMTVIEGTTGSAFFNVVIEESGTPAEYTYQWYVNGSAVEGATGSSFSKDDITQAAVHNVYCEVTNKAGTVKSRTATLSVSMNNVPVLISSLPADASPSVGESVTVEVKIEAHGTPAEYTYQWYENDVPIDGATSATYTKENLALGTYNLCCKVTNAAGTTTSRVAVVTVNSLYLYKNGKLGYTWKTAAKKIEDNDNADSTAPTITTDSNGIMRVRQTASYAGGIAYISDKIDLSKFRTLEFNGVMHSAHGDRDSGYGARLIAWTSIGSYITSNIAAQKKSPVNGTARIDISSLKSSYYIGFGVHHKDSYCDVKYIKLIV